MTQLIRLNHHSQTPINTKGLCLSIGNFDGVHIGHQAIIRAVQQEASESNLASAILFFEPQPLEFFRGQEAPPRIYNWRDKFLKLQQLGIDYVIIARFDHAFKSLSAEQFITQLQQLNVKKVWIGDDFRFGNNREGNIDSFKQAGLMVMQHHSVEIDQQRVSSTLIRSLLSLGSFERVSQALNTDYCIQGKVVFGDQIGRTLDFPTINIRHNRPKLALQGVFAVSVFPVDKPSQLKWQQILLNTPQRGVKGLIENSLFGAGHVGVRPAIKDQQLTNWRVEVYLPEFYGNLYGLRLGVVFHHQLHGEKNYPDLEALKYGIQEDVNQLLTWRSEQA